MFRSNLPCRLCPVVLDKGHTLEAGAGFFVAGAGAALGLGAGSFSSS